MMVVREIAEGGQRAEGQDGHRELCGDISGAVVMPSWAWPSSASNACSSVQSSPMYTVMTGRADRR